VLWLIGGCGASSAPTPPYEIPASREPVEMPTEGPTGEATREPEARAEPAVVAQGFTADAESGSASYAVVVQNPNPTWVPTFVNVGITFLDAEGTVLTTSSQNITGMLPESETAVAGDASEAGGATRLEVEILTLNLLPSGIRSSLAETGHYEFGSVQTAQQQSGLIRTTGTVLSRFESEQYNIPIHVVHYSAAGEVVGGAATHVDHLPPDGQVAFEANTSVTLPDIAETRVFGHVGFGD
jgi:hypothetical protein